MDKYPPLNILVQWREQGITPDEIHRRCVEYAGYNRPFGTPDTLVSPSGRICEGCRNEPHLARGMGSKCYGKWYYQRRVKK